VSSAKKVGKDRWRQVLSEADRIPSKHLLTLQTGISTNQTDEMQQSNLTLIVPEEIQETYTPEQRNQLWTLAQFIEYVKDKQKQWLMGKKCENEQVEK
jgi:hypothetical protein